MPLAELIGSTVEGTLYWLPASEPGADLYFSSKGHDAPGLYAGAGRAGAGHGAVMRLCRKSEAWLGVSLRNWR